MIISASGCYFTRCELDNDGDRDHNDCHDYQDQHDYHDYQDYQDQHNDFQIVAHD